MKIGDLHRLVWKDDPVALRKAIKENEHLSLWDIDDPTLLVPIIDCKWRGVTPLILAIQLGRTRCITVLLDLWADCLGRSSIGGGNGVGKTGFTPLQEAVSYGDRDIIKAVLERRHCERLQQWLIKEPLFCTSLKKEIPDLYAEFMISFQSWIPLSDSFLPPPVKLKLWKTANNIRIDSNFTSIETSPLSWTLGDLSILCKVNDGDSEVWVMDHQKKLFQRVDEGVSEMKQGLSLERQINYILNTEISIFRMAHSREPLIPPTPVVSSGTNNNSKNNDNKNNNDNNDENEKFYDAIEYVSSSDHLLFPAKRRKIKFKKKQSYWTGDHVVEEVMGRRCRVFELPDIEIITTSREEHLRSRHLQENPNVPWQSSQENNFTNETKADETNRQELLVKLQGLSTKLSRKDRYLKDTPSLKRPPQPSAETEMEWMSSSGDGSSARYQHLGRKMYGKSNWRRVPITVWMAIPGDPTNNIHLELKDLLPLIELSLLGNRHFDAIKQFLLDDLPKGEGFPCQVDIPLYSYLTARITFGRIILRGAEGTKIPAAKFTATNDDLFTIPTGFKRGDVLPADPSMTE